MASSRASVGLVTEIAEINANVPSRIKGHLTSIYKEEGRKPVASPLGDKSIAVVPRRSVSFLAFHRGGKNRLPGATWEKDGKVSLESEAPFEARWDATQGTVLIAPLG